MRKVNANGCASRPPWPTDTISFAFRFAQNDIANTLYFRESGDRLIVVSEPFDKEPDWAEVPINHALIARASKRAEIVPLLPLHTSTKQEPLQMERVVAGAQ